MEEQGINQEEINPEEASLEQASSEGVTQEAVAQDNVAQEGANADSAEQTNLESSSEASSELASQEDTAQDSVAETVAPEETKQEELKTETANKSEEASEQSSDESKEEPEEELGAGGLKKLSEEKEKFPWFVVHTYSGSEAKVKIALLDRIRNAKAEDLFGHIVVPEESVTEMVKGEKKTSKKKFFPGYIMVQCKLDEHAWHLVTGTPKVTGFVGDNVNPSPLSPEEVGTLLQQIEGNGPKSRVSIEFEQGDTVKVVDGPFSDFNGTVDDVKPEKGKLRVLISIFGRNTPVELDFFQVEKV